tara:strand:- start:9587 stop:10270 length:684 start_codon:yes stop_codon:yes gene_type:complete
MILGMYLQNHMPAKQQATLHDMLAEAQKMAKLADQWVEHCKSEDAEALDAAQRAILAGVSRDTVDDHTWLATASREERHAKIEAEHKTRRNEWLRDPDGGAEYLRLVLLNIMHLHRVESIVISDEEEELEPIHFEQDDMFRREKVRGFMKALDDVIGYLYDIDGPVTLQLNREDQSPCVLHCMYDCSNDAEEIIFDYHVSEALDAALDFAARGHSTTRGFYNNDQEG